MTNLPSNQVEYYNRLHEISIRDVAEELLSDRITRRTAKTFECNCPNHTSQSKTSLHINIETNQWYCFGCGNGEGGDTLQLVEFVRHGSLTKRIKGKMPETHKQARDWLAAKVGLPPIHQLNSTPEQIREYERERIQNERALACLTAIADFYHTVLLENQETLAAFQDKYKISLDTIGQFKIGYSDNTNINSFLMKQGFTEGDLIASGVFRSDFNDNTVSVLHHRYTFPYWSYGRVVYLIGRETQQTPKNNGKTFSKYYKIPTFHAENHPKVSKNVNNNLLFNEDILDTDAESIIIAEGITDALSCIDHGFAAISPVTVHIKRSDQPRIISKLRGKKVFICFDNEVSKVGEKGAQDTARLLETNGIEARIVTLPLNESQQKNRDRLELLGIIDHENATVKDIATAKKLLSSEDKDLFNRISSISKQDINSYFLNHSTSDFQKLLDSAPTRLGLILAPTISRLKKKEFSLLNDSTFLSAMSQAKEMDRAVFAEILDAASKVGLKRQVEAAIKQYAKTSPLKADRIQPVKTCENSVFEQIQHNSFPMPIGYDEVIHSLMLPTSYEFNKNGLDKLKELTTHVKRDNICPVPMFIAGRIRDEATREIALEVVYYTKKSRKWESVTIPRKAALDPTKLIAFSAVGFPIYAENKTFLSNFLFDFENTNIEQLEMVCASNQMGWLPGSAFLYGETYISPPEVKTDPISFISLDHGEKQATRSFATCGTADTWMDLAEDILPFYPHVAVLFYASFAAPLLKILNLNSFIVDLSAGTSSGKTIALRFAASAWGNPNEKTDSSLIHSWYITRTALERLASVQTDLPMFLDDTKTVGNPIMIDKFVYGLTEGHGKVRGSITGMQTTRSWRTVALSTGEAALSDYVTNAGAKARILSLDGYPFSQEDQSTREFVTRLNNIICRNYGHIGPSYINHLVNNAKQHDEWRDFYTYESTRLAIDSGAAARIADMRAVIATAAHLIYSAGIIPFEYVDPFTTLWPAIESEAKETDIGKRSMQFVWEWSNQHEISFIGRNYRIISDPYGAQKTIECTPNEEAGYWDRGDNFRAIYFYPQFLRDLLTKNGYDAHACIKSWKQHDWLIIEKDKSNPSKRTMKYKGTQKYALSREGFHQAHDSQLFQHPATPYHLSNADDSADPSENSCEDRPSISNTLQRLNKTYLRVVPAHEDEDQSAIIK